METDQEIVLYNYEEIYNVLYWILKRQLGYKYYFGCSLI